MNEQEIKETAEELVNIGDWFDSPKGLDQGIMVFVPRNNYYCAIEFIPFEKEGKEDEFEYLADGKKLRVGLIPFYYNHNEFEFHTGLLSFKTKEEAKPMQCVFIDFELDENANIDKGITLFIDAILKDYFATEETDEPVPTPFYIPLHLYTKAPLNGISKKKEKTEDPMFNIEAISDDKKEESEGSSVDE